MIGEDGERWTDNFDLARLMLRVVVQADLIEAIIFPDTGILTGGSVRLNLKIRRKDER
jgi:hypothetical protein